MNNTNENSFLEVSQGIWGFFKLVIAPQLVMISFLIIDKLI